MLRVIDNGKTAVARTQLVDLSRLPRADGKPIHIGVRANLLALVEVANQAITEDIAAEVDGDLLVEVDVLAVLVHALDAGDTGVLGGISLGCVGAVGGPGEHGQGDRLGNLLEEETVGHGHCC